MDPVMESLRLENRPKREYCRRFCTSYQELRASRFLSVPENVNCMPILQAVPPFCWHCVFGTAQSCLFRQTLPPEHASQPKLFQNKFWRVPSWNSRTCWSMNNQIQNYIPRCGLTEAELENVNCVYQSETSNCVTVVCKHNWQWSCCIFLSSKCNHKSTSGTLINKLPRLVEYKQPKLAAEVFSFEISKHQIIFLTYVKEHTMHLSW